MRRSGMALQASWSASWFIFAVIGVSMKPGATALQVTLRAASSRAMVLVRPTTPALDAE